MEVCVDATGAIAIDALGDINAFAANRDLFSELSVTPSEKASLNTIRDVPEITLFSSILTQGIYDLFYHNNADPGAAAKIRRDTKNWMLSNNTDSIVCFVSLCDLFLIDPDNLRQKLLSMISKGLVLQQRDNS